MSKNIKDKRDLDTSYAEFLRDEAEAAKNPNHPINDGLRDYFAERKRKLEKLNNEQNNHE